MKVCYVAGPYRAPTMRGIVENIRRAEEVAVELWRMGYAVICPHKNTALLDGAAPDDVWLKGDLELLRRSDLVVLCEGWQHSLGACMEHEEAIRQGIQVYEWPASREMLREVA